MGRHCRGLRAGEPVPNCAVVSEEVSRSSLDSLLLNLMSELAETEPNETIDKTRSQKVFLACKVSHKLLLFHVFFLKEFGSMQARAVQEVQII